MPPRYVHFTVRARETDRIATFTVKHGTFRYHLMYDSSVDSIVVTVCTTRFSVQKFYFQPTRCVCACFLWTSEQIAIISLHSVNWPAFMTETECVYWAVRAVTHVSVIISMKNLQYMRCFASCYRQSADNSAQTLSPLGFSVIQTECINMPRFSRGSVHFSGH